ncbi:uncharacterized protein LOC134778904 [Penaeus indicus]|uniref:uncharacterized protein LOC134778904 n=1 Tax=Penaeus indicus TaxID=29960 RepID=UPI00300C70E8
MAEFVIRAGKEILGETSGKIWKDKETWWFNAEVQRAITEKKEAKKKWEISPAERDKEEYKTKIKEAKRAVAIAKRKVFQLAKTRDKSTKDIVHIKQMKDENGNLISTEQGNIKRWEQYFSKLLNEGNERLIRGDGDANQGAVLEISRIEVQQALKKMKNGKATRPDGIPIEAWKAMGEEGIVVLRMLMGKVMEEENIPTVRCTVGMTDKSEVKVGLHQGSALSPILFNLVMDVMTEEVREKPPWCILYANDIVLVGGHEAEAIEEDGRMENCIGE